MEGESLALHKPQARKAARQCLERDFRFELAERGAKAVVNSLAKRERLRRVRASHVKRVRVRKHGGVVARGRKPEEKLRALR